MTLAILGLLVLAFSVLAASVRADSVVLRKLRERLLSRALPSARTGDENTESPRPEPRADFGLRWAEVTNLTPTGPDRPSSRENSRESATTSSEPTRTS
ncbi:MAG: hypothetical protein R3B81_09985 [bacterium]